MSMTSSLLTLATGVLATSIASAKPLAGVQHEPPLALDVTSIIQSVNGYDFGWEPESTLYILGAKSNNDRVRIEWKQRGKLVITEECKTSLEAGLLEAACKAGGLVKLAGSFDIDVIYTDDSDDREYLVATLSNEIQTSKGSAYGAWGAYRDDLLALAWSSWDHHDYNTPKTYRDQYIEFWSSTPDLHIGDKAAMRCSVNGTKLDEVHAEIRTSRVSHTATRYVKGNETVTHKWQRYAVRTGYRVGLATDTDAGYRTGSFFLGDHEGEWDCVLRREGKSLRSFSFKVDALGMVVPSQLQQSLRPPLGVNRDVTLVDATIPANHGELRVRPAVLAKTIGFGLPWPKGVRKPTLPPQVGRD